ncbi:CUB_2 domain-containing protein [Caenorhabditis elegans]|uniref:CUB_2 domain-containing protein n=1 Tax=Caenorhabditis elegans TaxID=6239 RepID=O45792_CAEEL|nr:CUB_2 domain-containing protein [Caenorhabditis elegans]CAB07486.2 CUB_2 domain-containing protein [Caenorhabditis elegans]|eukprot:NP_507367.2 Uncharacterized protein CELE_T19C9.8 [Caenorhabditis elegans]
MIATLLFFMCCLHSTLSKTQYDTYPTLYVNIFADDTQPRVLACEQQSLFIKADTRVTVTMLGGIGNDNTEYLRGALFFDGPNTNATFIGTGFQLLNRSSPFVASGQYMTVMGVETHSNYYFAFQDFENVKNITQLQWLQENVVELDGANGTVAMQLYAPGSFDTKYVLSSFEGDGKLDVYNGVITKNQANRVASYHAGNCSMNLPQMLFGDFTTFLYTGTKSKLVLTHDYNSFYEMNGLIGRKAFMASYFYGTDSSHQGIVADFSVQRNSGTSFRVSIWSDNFNEQTSQLIIEWPGYDKYSSNMYNITNLSPTGNYTFEITSYSMSVEYYFDSENTTSKGIYIDVELIKGSSALYYIYVIGLVCLWMIY